MAVAPVTLAESLRPWAGAGLAWLLADGPVRAPGMPLALPERPAQAASAPPPGIAPRQAVPNAQPAKPPSEPRASRPPSGPGRAADSLPAVFAFAAREDVPGNPQDWPHPWGVQFLKTKPAPVVWSYHELGLDLTGMGPASDRGALFRKMLAELRLPKGSSAFWPCAMPSDTAGGMGDAGAPHMLRANPSVFSAGLMRLSPQALVVAGKRALADMAIDSAIAAPFSQAIVEGKLVVLVPDTEALLRDETQARKTVSFLQAVLHSLAL